MAVPPPEFLELAKHFVCVRVTDLRDLDLARFRFDFDLTLAVLLAEADGWVWHRYGGRDPRDPQSALSMASLLQVMQSTLAERAARSPRPRVPESLPRTTVQDLSTFRQRDAEKRIDCVHCHTVNDFEYREAVVTGRFRREQLWVFPDPSRLGIEVDRDQQQRIVRVEGASPAARAGLEVGDRLRRVAEQDHPTRADLQWVLHHLPAGACELPVEIERGTGTLKATLALAEGWKVADPLEYSWRPYKWNLPPHPGFGGGNLSEPEKQEIGLAPDAFAFRVNYVVTWGENSRTGRNAARAGIRKGDVLLGAAGKSDFTGEAHFQSWFRLTQRIGATCELSVLREGVKHRVELPIIE